MRILVVDDNDQMRELLRLILESAGHETMEAANGKIALELLGTRPADLVITDIVMPEMEGTDLIMTIGTRYPDVRIVAISGGGKSDPNAYLKTAGKRGADRILHKPFGKSAILSIIGELFPGSP